ncbi:hypothetical protein [Streptomyces kronopolitis]|uniref:hypothetical protein n=1 Tax=Streptomyces kronopolitis TaxID=1612435 RepID=UPI00341D76C2
MMGRAHLFAVPDPDDEQSPGERLAAVLQPDPAPELQTQPDADRLDDTEKADDVDEPDIDEEVEDAGEEPRRRAFTLPDLSPYYDVRPLKELGPLAVEAGRHGGPPLRRALARAGHALACAGLAALVGFLCLCHGLRLLLVLLIAWLSGQTGKRGSIPARFGIAAGAAYVLATAPAQHPAVPYAMAAAFLLLLIAAGTGRIPEPGSKKTGKKAGEKGKKDDGETGEKGKRGNVPEKAPAAGEGAEKEEPKDAARGGILGRLARLANSGEKNLAVDLTTSPVEAADGSPAEAGDQCSEAAQETPAEPPLTALLRREIGAENGVHLADLRPAMRAALPGLSSATNKELREVLEKAGWNPSKTFRARGRAGRAGVHRNQLPPLPSPGDPQEGAVNHSPHPGDRPRPANSSEAERGGERGGERLGKRLRIMKDPERGPAGWKVEHDGR